MNVNVQLQLVRIAAVIALLGATAALVTPKGRLPLALRGLAKTLGRPVSDAKGEKVSVGRRLLAFFLLIVVLILVCL